MNSPLNIKRIPRLAHDREKWLAERRNDVTGSEIGALFGLHRYKTAAGLYADKVGAMPEDKKGPDGPMRRGIKLESFVADELARRHPDWGIAKSNDYYRDVDNRIGGTPDYIVQLADGYHRVLEIKTVGVTDFKAIWQGGDPDATPLPELWQLMQCLTYQHLTGFRGGIIAVLVIGEWTEPQIHEIEVPRNEKLISKMLERTREFWQRIEQGVPPEFDYSRDMDVIKALYASAEPDSKLDLTWDLEVPALFERRDDLKLIEKDAQANLKEVEARIRAKFGDFETIIVNGWEATLKSQHNSGYTVEPYNYRVLRAKRKKE